MAPNRFCALSRQEFVDQYLGALPPGGDLQRQALATAPQPPDSVDWAAAGKVPSVKLQQWVRQGHVFDAGNDRAPPASCACF